MTTPSKSRILDHWLTENRLYEEHGIFLDWGEPSCWACGYGWDGIYDVGNPKTPHQELLKLWERAPLQRCHIIPRALGGTDDVANVVLMCAECHDLAPDTSDRGLCFRWMTSQCFWKRSTRRVNEAVEAFGLNHENQQMMARLLGVLRSDDFKRWSRDHTGLHGRQSPPFGVRLKPSTMIAAVLLYAERMYPGVPLHEIPVPSEMNWVQ